MFKALIIDDEKHVREAIKIMGSWNELNVDAVFEADDGGMGLEELRKNRPDIVLVDMKMPGLDGVQFLNMACRECPQAKYIVVSGYDDFEYTKGALKSKAIDYLLKPIDENELNDALAKAVNELTNDNRIRSRTDLLLKERFYSSAIFEGFDERLKDEHIKTDSLNWDESKLHTVAVLKCLNYNEVCAARFRGDDRAYASAISDAVGEVCSGNFTYFCFRNYLRENEFIIMIHTDEDLRDKAEDMVCRGLKAIIDELEKLFGIFSVSCVGGFFNEIGGIRHSFEEADSLIEEINLFKLEKQVFTYVKRSGSGKISLFERKQLLFDAFESESLGYASNVLNDYLDTIAGTGFLSAGDAKRLAVEYLLIIEDICRCLNIDAGEIVSPYFRHGSLEICIETFESLKRFMYEILNRAFDRIKEKIAFSKEDLANKVKEYIDLNYFEEISLGTFSDKFHFSKQYMAKIFKEAFGCGIYEYLLNVRMAKAKEMLGDRELKIQDIAEKLGYSESNYFSKAFKKYYNISPLAYRRSIDIIMN